MPSADAPHNFHKQQQLVGLRHSFVVLSKLLCEMTGWRALRALCVSLYVADCLTWGV
jgi:hypothetical protein